MERDEALHDRLGRLPKAELHVHLDGSLRAGTMFDLARERGVSLPEATPDELAHHMLVRDATRLEDYLERFDRTLSVMQDADALERIAFELIEDHAAEHVRYVEVRFCPLLNTKQGLGPDEALEATLRGLRRAEQACADIQASMIVCGLRSHPAEKTLEMSELAIAYADRGVCGFDIAGAEAGNPVQDHVEAFDRAAVAGMPITIHAGEGYGPDSIRQALELGHARRIGHGTRLREDPALLELVSERGIPLEVCLTSNVQTRVVASHADHPARQYLRAGIPISLGTDNRLMSGVTLTSEYQRAAAALGMTWSELVTVARAGFAHAFVTPEQRETMLHAFDQAIEEGF
jgi:adenosine deaminase